MTFEECMAKIRQTGRSPIVGDLSSTELINICRYLELKPTPNADGNVNKPERFAAFLEYYMSVSPTMDGEVLEAMYPYSYMIKHTHSLNITNHSHIHFTTVYIRLPPVSMSQKRIMLIPIQLRLSPHTHTRTH